MALGVVFGLTSVLLKHLSSSSPSPTPKEVTEIENPIVKYVVYVVTGLAGLWAVAALIVLFGGFITMVVISTGDSSTEEECRIEDRGGSIREICWWKSAATIASLIKKFANHALPIFHITSSHLGRGR